MKRTLPVLLGLLIMASPAAVQAQFTYTTNNGTIALAAYTGSGGAVVISNFVTSIGYFAFIDCYSLTSITIPGSVTSIGDDAFFGCTSLTGATIANGVTSIGEGAFEGAGLTSVIVPGSITNIGYGAFSCFNLTAITVDTNNAVYSSKNGVLFDKSQTTLVQFPGGIAGSYTIPAASPTSARCVRCLHGLTSVTIPGSVTSIGNDAFDNCTGLTSVTIPASVTNIGDGAFGGCTA